MTDQRDRNHHWTTKDDTNTHNHNHNHNHTNDAVVHHLHHHQPADEEEKKVDHSGGSRLERPPPPPRNGRSEDKDGTTTAITTTTTITRPCGGWNDSLALFQRLALKGSPFDQAFVSHLVAVASSSSSSLVRNHHLDNYHHHHSSTTRNAHDELIAFVWSLQKRMNVIQATLRQKNQNNHQKNHCGSAVHNDDLTTTAAAVWQSFATIPASDWTESTFENFGQALLAQLSRLEELQQQQQQQQQQQGQ